MAMTLRVVMLLAMMCAAPAIVLGQTLGTFRWQLQPYCNVITVTITQVGSAYRVEGTDDQCGGGRDQAAVQGMAFANPDGTIGFGLTIITAPGGAPVHLDADMSVASASGTWRDSDGGAGAFVFTAGVIVPGPRRGVPQTIPPAMRLSADGSVLARGSVGAGGAPASGSGTRLMWYAGKAAFRAGTARSTEWDDANLGVYSTAFGHGTRASGDASTALGRGTDASGFASTALGAFTSASGDHSLATGIFSVASGVDALAGGLSSIASGAQGLAFGYASTAAGAGSVALGSQAATTSAASGSFVFADASINNKFTSSAPNEFGARFAGGYYLYTKSNLSTGVALAPNGSSWAALSDVNAKENFRDVDGEALLGKLARIPIREWNYKAQDAGLRHMGPTAQDFRAAFGLGDFPLRINTIDADGVALAGVQALEARTRALQALVDELQRRLDALTPKNPAPQ